MSSSPWRPVLERMFDELASGQPRAESYWAQQLAFAPVLFFAVVAAVREDALDEEQIDLLHGILPMALAALGVLPDGCDGDPAAFYLLARRQASALVWGRRRQILKLASRIGLDLESAHLGVVPRRLRRPYPLLGWRPP